jgi:CheY-like chemotaxis protein
MNKIKSVLLVEDDEADQYFFKEALRKIEGAKLHGIAANGREALDRLTDPTALPDLIFTDINMPVMNGIECLSAIKKIPHAKDIPVVVLSTDTSKAEEVHSLGAKAFIKKPEDFRMLGPQLEQMINLDFTTDAHIAEQTFHSGFSAF